MAWQPRDYSRSDPAERSLVVVGPLGRVEVALVNRRADGVTWLATTNRHLPWDRRRSGVHATRAHAVRMLSRWAAAHAGRLLAEAGGRGRSDPAWGRPPAGLQRGIEGASNAP